jgi:2-polyprenyl-3-methyl-5-hydroxy-6-metoxy-1,4-benzoquinol methylase
MEILKSCPVCENTRITPYMSSRDHFLSGEAFHIVRCSACTFLFTNPRPPEDSMPGYYHSEEYISHSNTNKGLINQVYKLVRNYSLDKKVALIKRHQGRGSVLDIGCGTGHFLHRLAKHGYQVRGVEPEPSARSFAMEQFNLEVVPDLEVLSNDPGEFSTITLWHVLEHVYHLDAYMHTINKLLHPDGTLIIALPNPESEDAKSYQEFWAAFDLPRHLYHFTQKSMTALSQKYGYDLVEILPMKFDAYYVSMLSEKYKHGKNKYLKAFYTGLKSNRKARRHMNNYSSLIYVLKPKN